MKPFFEKRAFNIATGRAEMNSVLAVSDLKNYPRYVYKYRDCDKEYNFEMIEEGYLWADTPESFVDPIDSIVNLKLKSELPEIQKWIYNHLGELLYFCIPPKGMQPQKHGQTLQNHIDAQERFADESGRYNAKKAKLLMLKETKKLHPNQQRALQRVYDRFESPEFDEQVTTTIEKTLKNVTNCLRKSHLVSCVTARKDNRKMWEEYANRYTGFVIEYDLSRAIECREASLAIGAMFPVQYYKRMPRVPLMPFIQKAFYKELYEKDIAIDTSSNALFRQLLIKRHDYRTEEEWRIIATENRVYCPIISAVYAGNRISSEDMDRLRDICAKQGIPLFKQEFSLYNGDIQFKAVL